MQAATKRVETSFPTEAYRLISSVAASYGVPLKSYINMVVLKAALRDSAELNRGGRYVDDGFEIPAPAVEALNRWLKDAEPSPKLIEVLREKADIPYIETSPDEWL